MKASQSLLVCVCGGGGGGVRALRRHDFALYKYFLTSYSSVAHIGSGGALRSAGAGLTSGTTPAPNSKHWFMTSFLQPLPYLGTPYWVPENCQLSNEQFFCFCLFVCFWAQTVVSLLQTTQIWKEGVSFTAANKVYTSADKTTFVWIETETLSHPGWMRLMFMCVLWR